MKKYFLKKLAISVITLILIVLILFLMMDMMPGSPFNNPKLTEAQKAQLMASYGLDKPVFIRFLMYLKNILHGDFGVSYTLSVNTPVSQIIAARLPISMAIGAAAMVIGSILGLALGYFAAFHAGKAGDMICLILFVIGISVPSFIFAIVISYFFGFEWNIFPLLYDFRQPVLSSIMAVSSMSIYVMAVVGRYTRDEASAVLKSDYVQFAVSQGISQRKILRYYVIRNSMMGVITVMAMLLVGLLTGSLVTEQIFAIPGIGFLMSKAISANDYNVVIALAFVFAAIYVTARLILDVLYGLIDPRVRVGGRAE